MMGGGLIQGFSSQEKKGVLWIGFKGSEKYWSWILLAYVLYKIFGSFDNALIIYLNELSKAAQPEYRA
ncbi:hypothetical protein F2Q69_00015442 [Brassica cretica]|uniref:Uncharacterized protein n=1 Tax=Brassica cretica TaxID=69181 RepID=A0A8S9QUI2_BRACR|nr:hypothetical protein F2Q69_00015442 [Brassica cretica]